MINDLLKPLEWDWSYGDGGKTNAVCRAKSPSHEYIIRLEAGGDFYVDYRKFDNDEDSDNRKDEPPVFDSMKAAQDWVQLTHYPSKMAKWLNTDPLTDTVNWIKEAKPEPTDKDRLVQIGCHFEEVCEHLEAMGCEGGELGVMAYELKTYTKEQPDSVISKKLNEFNNLDLLDALADQIVTAVGVAYMMGFDIIGALTEVNASNWSKFENGKAVTDENGKIIKGSGYFKPELDRFVGGSDEG